MKSLRHALRSQVREDSSGKVGNVDVYLDDLLHHARNDPEVRAKIDPLFIPDIRNEEATVSDIKIHGLLNLARAGPALIIDLKQGNFVIEATVGVNQVEADGRYRYRHGIVRAKGRVCAKVERIRCNVSIAIQNDKAILKRFNLVAMSDLRVTKVTGLTAALNWLPKMLANRALSENRRWITNVLESGARHAISEVLEKVDINQIIWRPSSGKLRGTSDFKFKKRTSSFF